MATEEDMTYPEELRYTKTHEWTRRDGDRITVGITDYAQKEISDVVFIEVPKQGKDAEQGKPIAVVESVKAAFDIYAPLSGKVVNVNTELEENPALVNQDCYGKGWFFELEPGDAGAWDLLMTAEQYRQMIKAQV